MPPSQTNQPFQSFPIPPAHPGPVHQAASQRKRPLGLLFALVFSVLLLVAALGFGVWAYGERQDYKQNSDKKAAAAVTIAVQQEGTRKDNEFLEKEKNPLKTYNGSSAYGSLSISYPKTWSAYVIETDKGGEPINGYFHPNFVPGTQSQTAYALRVQVSGQSYEQEMKQFESKVKAGKVSVTPFVAKNVPTVTGARVDGEINTGQKNSMILLPIRDKTIKISTESQQFLGDFNDIILANLKFVP